MADKYLKANNGAHEEVEGLVESAGAGDAGKIPALTDAGLLALTLMPVGIGPDTASIVATEDLAAGDFVNIYNDAGVAKCRKADATTVGKEVWGYVLAVVTNGNSAQVYFEGHNTQVTGLTPGPLFLSTTAGLATSTCPTASGNIQQKLGVAVSAVNMNFEHGNFIILA